LEVQGAKSLIIITYQILSHKYNKWVSLKAYMILNSLEVVFWAAVAFMMIQVNLKFCMGTNCILSWAVCGVGGTLRYVLKNVLELPFRRHDGWLLFHSAVAAWTAVVLSRIGITSRQMDIIVEPRLPLRTILLRMDAHSNELTLKGNRH
jgi:hypothetical protein